MAVDAAVIIYEPRDELRLCKSVKGALDAATTGSPPSRRLATRACRLHLYQYGSGPIRGSR
jgi:preprotein translocase subunit SecD